MKIIRLALVGSLVILLANCSSLPTLTSKNTACLSKENISHNDFIATGSGLTLEQAKINLRADLASQISSNISVSIDATTSDVNGKIKRSGKKQTTIDSSNIPIDQYKVIETCSNGKTFFARGSLSHESLILSVQARLKNNNIGIQKILNNNKNSAPYDRYLARESLKKLVTKARLYIQLLDRYATSTANNKKNQFWINKANVFLNKNQHLKIRLTASNDLRSLLPLIAESLQKADLKYSQTERKPVVKIYLSGKFKHNKINKTHISQLAAVLNIHRADSNELLASLDLGKVSGQSSIDYAKAKNVALKKLKKTLKSTLRRHQINLRQKLGLKQ